MNHDYLTSDRIANDDRQAMAWQQSLANAVCNAPSSVVQAWIDAGARADKDAFQNAITGGRSDILPALLDAVDDRCRPDIPKLLTDAHLLDNDDMLAAVLKHVTPAELNERPGNSKESRWATAFLDTPVHDPVSGGAPDPARIGRFPRVLAMFKGAGARMELMHDHPDFGLNSVAKGRDPQGEVLRTVLRVEHEQALLRSTADEACCVPSHDALDKPAPARARARL